MTGEGQSLLARLLMPGVAGHEMDDVGQPVSIATEEAALVSAAGEKRRRDFTLGRWCAHAALAQLGGDDGVIGLSKSGAPLWPDGFCGSITHTAGYAAAMVARRAGFLGLGVDAERVGGVTQKLWPRLFDADETALLAALSPDLQMRVATILFSAKEACFKAWSPLGAAPQSFRDMHVALRDDGFDAISAAGFLTGRFAVRDDLVLTAASIPAR